MIVNLSDPSSPLSIRRAQLDRRGVVGIVGAAVVAAPALALLPDLPADARPVRTGGRLSLQADPNSPVKALDIPLGVGSERRVTNRPTRSAILETTEFSALGVTWVSGSGGVRVRTRTLGGDWTSWRPVAGMGDHRPDRGTDEGHGTPRGTALAWVGPSDAVQLELHGTQVAPTLTLIDPGHVPTDVTPELHDRTTTSAKGTGDDPVGSGDAPPTHHPRFRPVIPEVHRRPLWHPNLALMNPPIAHIASVRQVHVHHTDTPNGYHASEVPRLLRAMFRYHTATLGWADIAYNFLVDRFGRIWVGRHGSMHMARGAHTLGFNDTSVGIAAVGNYQNQRPDAATLHAIARVAAWKLALFDRHPKGTIAVTSTGSDKFRAGRRVVLPVIDGHRNTNDTACPGNHLYADLDTVRVYTKRRMSRFRPADLERLKQRL